MTCPVGWFSAVTEVLWEEYEYSIKKGILVVLILINLYLL